MATTGGDDIRILESGKTFDPVHARPRRAVGLLLRGALGAFVLTSSCRHAPAPVAPRPAPPPEQPAPQPRPEPVAERPPTHRRLSAAEKGVDADAIPRYLKEVWTSEERKLLRSAFGVEAPERLYFSDSSDAAILKYDVKPKTCKRCYVNSYRLGFLSLRRPGETWDEFEVRLQAMRPKDFGTQATHVSMHELEPGAEAAFTELLAAARKVGFKVSVIETYRTPEKEAQLLSQTRGRTYTATSMHSYGRAVDFKIDDGNTQRPSTQRDWVRFRKFVVSVQGGQFRLVGRPEDTWDWTHVELPSADIGFRSVDEALAFARRCLNDSERSPDRSSGVVVDPCVIPAKVPAPGPTKRAPH